MNLVLIGYRGTGKTSVARELALRLGWDWIDCDVEVELRAGKSIRAIFSDEGEPAFRELEVRVLAELVERDWTVIAAGGGAVLRADNRAALGRADQVIWLTASPERLWERIEADATTSERRPNLTAGGGLDEIRRLLEERRPHYHECATLVCDTEKNTPAEIAAVLIDRLQLPSYRRARS
jgi:shikimate kinase